MFDMTKKSWVILAEACAIAASCAAGNRSGPLEATDNGMDGNAAYAAVVELADRRYAGRITGSEGNALARAYIGGRLKAAGLSVRTMEYDDRVAVNSGQALLEASAGGSHFLYRQDFREVIRGGYDGGRATGPLFVMQKTDDAFSAGSILLIKATLYDAAAVDSWAAAGAAGLLVELAKGSTGQRPLWAGQAPGSRVEVKVGMIVLGLSSEAHARLEADSEATATPLSITMSSPARFADVSGVDILAEWNGDGGRFKPGIVVMAHYDHVGTDADGSRFPGALDNASGVGIALAIAEALARNDVKLDVAILITDGEETGLSGARAFAAAPPFPLKGLRVINIDMAGSRNDVQYAVYSSGGESSAALSLEVEKALRLAGVDVQSMHPVDTTDHVPLAQAGAAAITVCEYDTTRYHMKDDEAEFVDPAELDVVGNALYMLITRLAKR